MPLTMTRQGGKYFPRVHCDHCGERILDARDGNALHDLDARQGGIFFVHKGCSDDFEEARPAVSWGWLCLPPFLTFLGNGLRVKWPKARRQASLLGSVS